MLDYCQQHGIVFIAREFKFRKVSLVSCACASGPLASSLTQLVFSYVATSPMADGPLGGLAARRNDVDMVKIVEDRLPMVQKVAYSSAFSTHQVRRSSIGNLRCPKGIYSYTTHCLHSQVLLCTYMRAWPCLVPIPGFRRKEHAELSVKAQRMGLTDHQWTRIRNSVDPSKFIISSHAS